jgi:hypothetical protein
LWSCHKSFIKPCSSSIPPLQNGELLAEDEKTKADILNDYFIDQALLNEPEQISAIFQHSEPCTSNMESFFL